MCGAIDPDDYGFRFVSFRGIALRERLIGANEHSHGHAGVAFTGRGGRLDFETFHRAEVASGTPGVLKILERVALRGLPQRVGLLRVAGGERGQKRADGFFRIDSNGVPG